MKKLLIVFLVLLFLIGCSKNTLEPPYKDPGKIKLLSTEIVVLNDTAYITSYVKNASRSTLHDVTCLLKIFDENHTFLYYKKKKFSIIYPNGTRRLCFDFYPIPEIFYYSYEFSYSE